MKYFREAFEAAQKSPHNNQKKYGAVLVYRGKIVSRGYNNYKSGVFTSGKGKRHAEIDAILQFQYRSKIPLAIRRRMKGLDLYVVRCNRDETGMEKCALCYDCQSKIQKLINSGFVKNVYPSTNYLFD